MKAFTLLFFISLLTTKSIQAQDVTVARNASFEVRMDSDLCQKLRPHNKTIKVKLNDDYSFELFSYTSNQFDPNKDSILFINGGPGGIWSVDSQAEMQDIFPEHNIVFFDYRGGGCSSFPSLDESLDIYLNSAEIVKDIETIRKLYNVDKWKLVYGNSFGTNLARKYANENPERLKSLILDGLARYSDQDSSDEEGELNSAFIAIKESIQQGRTIEGSVLAGMDEEVYQAFYESYINLLESIDPDTQFACASNWEQYKEIISQYYLDAGVAVPTYINDMTFMATTLIMYYGFKEIDIAIVVLLNEFGFIELDSESINSYYENLKTIQYYLFPYLDDKYLDRIEKGMVSTRVNRAVNQNDSEIEKDENLCTNVPILVLSGKQDVSTPLKDSISYLENKSCSANDSNYLVVAEELGHVILNDLECLKLISNDFLGGIDLTLRDYNCEGKVSLRKF